MWGILMVTPWDRVVSGGIGSTLASTETLAGLLTTVGSNLTSFVPDFAIYIAAAVVVLLVVLVFQRLVKAGR